MVLSWGDGTTLNGVLQMCHPLEDSASTSAVLCNHNDVLLFIGVKASPTLHPMFQQLLNFQLHLRVPRPKLIFLFCVRIKWKNTGLLTPGKKLLPYLIFHSSSFNCLVYIFNCLTVQLSRSQVHGAQMGSALNLGDNSSASSG